MTTVPICVVDAFTDKPFTGNPAAVCVLEKWRDDKWLQNVAAEMNLSETAFLVRKGDTVYHLRWFTPNKEVDLCGHATLASAHLLWETGAVISGSIILFDTKSGRLTAHFSGKGISLDFPSIPSVSADPPQELIESLGMNPFAVMKAGPDYLVEVSSAGDVRELTPDFGYMRQVDMRAVVVTARGDEPGVDFVSRVFAPALGIDEDPVTGSTHCALGPYWVRKLKKSVFTARQLSKRGGSLEVAVKGDRVTLTGKAVTVWTGELID